MKKLMILFGLLVAVLMAHAQHIAIVFDNSSSVGISSNDDYRQACHDVLADIHADEYTIIAAAGTAGKVVSTSRHARYLSGLDQVFFGPFEGNTLLHHGIRKAGKELRSGDIMIIVTDGKDARHDLSKTEVSEVIANGVSIFVTEVTNTTHLRISTDAYRNYTGVESYQLDYAGLASAIQSISDVSLAE